MYMQSPYYQPTGMGAIGGFYTSNSYNTGGLQQVAYDPTTGQYVTPNPNYTTWGTGRTQPQWIPVGSLNNSGLGANLNQAPSVDFNALPSQVPTGLNIYGAGTQATPYQRPTQPTAPTGTTGYRPQFDPSFIQQMLAQRFGNNQGTGIPTTARPVGPPTLTPKTTHTYAGFQGEGGLGALRAMGNQAPAVPVGGTTNAPV